MMNDNYHIPVLLNDAVEGLKINPEGVYVDVTYGGGGHSREILKRLTTGKLIAFDQDADAEENLIQDDRLIFVKQNFSFLKNYLRMYGVLPVDGILADLGVSSHQFNTGERGFSTRYDAKLDMRMDQSSDRTAYQVVNNYDEEELKRMFYEYGELRKATLLARAIIQARADNAIETVFELKEILKRYANRGKENQFFAKVFQALRIEVNAEMDVLKKMLEQSVEVLKPGGRLVVISYHSLEDRLVKNLIKKGKFSGEVDKDFYGNVIKPLGEVTRKPISPTETEIETNNRARSARLRIAEKLK